MSNAVRIIRALAYESGAKPHHIYNDARQGWGRSVKVLGWTDSQYMKAVKVLHAAGMSAKMVKRPAPYKGYRLWVM